MAIHRIVCLGGGTGQGQVLKGLKDKPVRLAAIVNVTDNGGHTGELRRLFGVPAVGDLRNCLEALCGEARLWEKLLSHRFRQGNLDGTSLGNLLLVALIQREGSLSKAADLVCRELGVRHRILPASDQPGQICARLEGGPVIEGEWEILLRNPRVRIVDLFHEPPIRGCRDSIREIEQADLIVISPGSLFTGILSCLITRGIRQALRRSRTKQVMVINLMTQPGQSDQFGAREHVQVLAHYMGRPPDVVVMNTGRPPPSLIRKYGEAGARMVEDDLGNPKEFRVIRADLVERFTEEAIRAYERGGKGRFHVRPHFIRHDPERLGRILLSLL